MMLLGLSVSSWLKTASSISRSSPNPHALVKGGDSFDGWHQEALASGAVRSARFPGSRMVAPADRVALETVEDFGETGLRVGAFT